MTIKSLIGVAAFAIASMSAAEQVVPEGTNAAQEPKSRSEVLTELSLWQRAGLNQYNAEGADQSSLDYQRRMDQYAQMRNGPQYVTELQRIQDAHVRHAAVQANQPS